MKMPRYAAFHLVLHIGACIVFVFSFSDLGMYIVTRALSLSKYLSRFEKKILQHEDSHEFPRIRTLWFYKYV